MLVLYSCFILNSQNQDIAFPHIIPMTPNAASLSEYSDYPVSYYTGIPDINIPLYEIDIDGFKIPITLNYHASGIRVDQESSWVGLGWSLNIGGMISRTVKSVDDFLEHGWDRYYPYCIKGYYNAPDISYNIDNHYDMIGTSCCDGSTGVCFKYVLKYDPEPDIFFYNLPQISGKFILDKSRGAILFDKSHNIKVDVIKSGSYVTFKITDSEGNQYFYNDKETTRNYTANSSLYLNSPNSNTKYDDETSSFIDWQLIRYPDCSEEMEPGPVAPYNMTTSWCLSRIITKNGREIKFTYKTEDQYLPTQESCENYHASNGRSFKYYYKSKITNTGKRLSKIEGDFGYITFQSSPREDIKGTSEKLDEIVLYAKDSSLIKSYQFDYTYFNDNYSGDYKYTHVFKRLKLNKLTEYNSDQIPLNKGYEFQYYEGSFPAKNSKNVDYWGFQNGKQYGADYYIGIYLSNNIKYPGASKNANFNYVIRGTLREIVYPTGGKTEFEYESNTFPSGIFQSTVPDQSTSVEYVNLPVYNNYIMNQHDYPSDTIYRFDIQGKTELRIRCTVENENSSYKDPQYNYYHASLNPLGILKRVSPSSYTYYTYECPYVFDRSLIYPNGPVSEKGEGGEIELTERMFTLTEGVYEFKAFKPPKDVVAYWQLNINRLYPPVIDPSTPMEGGGIRISQIISESKIRKFTYPMGKMLVEPSLYYVGTRIGIPNNEKCFVQVSESKTPLSTFNNGNFVGYDWVEESVGSSQGIKTRYFYHNDPETEKFDDTETFPESPVYINYNNGLIKSINKYANTSVVQREEYYYKSTSSTPINAFIDRSQKRHSSDLLSYNYTIEWPLVEKIISSQDNVVSETGYTYNSRDLPQAISFNIGGSIRQKIIKYPFDFNDNLSLSMVNKNMIGIPIEIINLKDNMVVSGENIQYVDTLNLLLPKIISFIETETPLSLSAYKNKYRSNFYFERYNEYGKVLQTRNKNYVISYLWSYNSLYPIAEIINASYSDLESVLGGASHISAFAKKLDPTKDEIDTFLAPLFIHDKTKNAHITSYVYKPLIGIISKTDPNGVVTYYEYDSSGRLRNIKDSNGKIVEQYRYNYKTP